MSLTFPPMINQVTVPINTANNNTLVTLTCSSTITKTAMSLASCIVTINPTLAISVSVTWQDDELG